MKIEYGDNHVKLVMLPNAPLNIIDHGSVVYLSLLQIRFYDQQGSLSLLDNNNNNNNNNTAMEYLIAVNNETSSANSDDGAPHTYYFGDTTVSITSASIVIDPESTIVIGPESSTVSVTDEATFSVVMTTFDITFTPALYTSLSFDTGTDPSCVFVADEATFPTTTITMTTQVYSPSSYDLSNLSSLNYNNNLCFDTIFDGCTG